MSKRKSNQIKMSLALMVAVCGLMSANTRAARQDLPEGKGAELARDRCVICHEADVIVSQRLSHQGWTREVEKMIRWGAAVSEEEKEVLIDYFAGHFKPRSAAGARNDADSRGKKKVEQKELLWQQAGLTDQSSLVRHE